MFKDFKGFDVEALKGQAVRISTDDGTISALVKFVTPVELSLVMADKRYRTMFNPSGAYHVIIKPEDVIQGKVKIQILKTEEGFKNE